MTTIIVGNGAFREASLFSISSLSSLESFEIGDYCFRSITSFVLYRIPNLVTLKIGQTSFTPSPSSSMGDTSTKFTIKECDKLESIEIGEMSFTDYAGSFQIATLPSLKRLIIGSTSTTSNNFKYGSFSINSIFIYLYESNY